MGTIEVNLDVTATLDFDKKEVIDFTLIGNNPKDSEGNFINYEIFQRDNTVTIKPLHKDVPETSIVVRLANGDVFSGMIRFGNNGKIFYPFYTKSAVDSITVHPVSTAPTVNLDLEVATRRLKQVVELKDKFYTFAVKENGLVFSVTQIVNDDKFTYFKLKIINRSGNDFIIDGILLKYQLHKRKGLKKNEIFNEERPAIVTQVGESVVPAYQEETVGIACPIFAVGEKGILKVQILEKKGNRTATIEIDGSEIINIDVLN